MEIMRKSLFAILLIFVLIFSGSHEMVKPSEGRVCKSQSHHFHGTCLSDHNCAQVCRTEGGFSGGDCVGFRRRCFCTRHC